MFGIDWSDSTQQDILRKERISHWYNQAMDSIRQGGATILGKEINPENHKEVIAFLYLVYKDYYLFHEKL